MFARAVTNRTEHIWWQASAPVDEVVDGVYKSATHCARCDKPLAPYGVAVPTATADTYCWGDTQHRITDLEKALADAIECIDGWGAYADDYFKNKWNLEGDIARLRAVLDGGEWKDSE